MSELFPRMVDKVPVGQIGVARIEHFEVSKHDAEFSRLRAAIGHADEAVDAGHYAKLIVDGALMMTDTQMERSSNYSFAYRAKGNVLVAGLGLGMILHHALAKPEVASVTVIEKYQDVIDLVAPTLAPEKLTIVCADIFEWRPAKGAKWDTIYFDIWPDISEDNLAEMTTLHRRFARRLNAGGWMDSWKRGYLRGRARRTSW